MSDAIPEARPVTTLRILHRTTYDYDDPVPYALQQIRLTPQPFCNDDLLLVAAGQSRCGGCGIVHLD